MRSAVFCVFVALSACGPSSGEIRSAQTAVYKGSPSELYAIAVQTAAEDYKIGREDPGGLTFATLSQWYSPEGGRQSAGAGDMVQLDDRSVNLMLVVTIEELDAGQYVVRVHPMVQQFISGSPQPRTLAEEDPNMPPWIHGRVESLQVAIHSKAKGLAVTP